MANEKEKILVVDDERLVRWTLLKKFTEWGFEPREAAAIPVPQPVPAPGLRSAGPPRACRNWLLPPH